MVEIAGRALVVTTGRARGSLAAVRALGRAGWIVGVGLPDVRGIVTASQWCQQHHLVPRPRGDARPFIEAVRAAVDEGGYDIVFGGGDDSMAALALYRDDIPAVVAHPPSDVVMAAIDKVEVTRRGAAAGFATPYTKPATEQARRDWLGPVVVKCQAHWQPGQRHDHRIEARRYPDILSAADRIRFIVDAGLRPVLQQTIDGHLGALVGVMHGGRLIGRIQQEASGVWPTPNGVSSRAQTVDVDEALVARAEALLNDLGWVGLVELQFVTPAGGEPHLVDLNGRFYGSMALASAAGVNLADAWARQALGRPVPDLADGRVGVTFAWTAGDLRRAFAERRGGLMADIASTLWWARKSTTNSVWDRHDIGPATAMLAAAVTSTLATLRPRSRHVAARPADDRSRSPDGAGGC